MKSDKPDLDRRTADGCNFVRLVDLHDETNVIRGDVVSQRLHVITVRHVTRRGRPFHPERFWEGTFDARSGLPLYDNGAFRIHGDDLVQFLRGQLDAAKRAKKAKVSP